MNHESELSVTTPPAGHPCINILKFSPFSTPNAPKYHYFVNKPENIHFFLKISPEKFGGLLWNAYLCIRFWTETFRPVAFRSLKEFHEDREVVQESRRLVAPLWRVRHPAAGRDTSRSIFFEGAFGSMRRSVLGQDRTAGAADAAEAFEDTDFTMESLILAQDER